MLWVLIWLPLLGPNDVLAGSCYSCSGVCKTEPCNCQMGICESDHCFTEKRADPTGNLRIIKGCIKRPARRIGCDYDRNKEAIVCTCNGDFCNDIIQMAPIPRRNITCKYCNERDPKCSDTCIGQWCFDSSSGQSGCGFGPPALPYFYEKHELLLGRNLVCVTISRGNGIPIRHCICNTHMCNDMFGNQHMYGVFSGHQRSRSVTFYQGVKPEIHKCVSCDVSTQDSSVTTSCRQNICYGHFCTYTSQRFLAPGGLGQRMQAQATIYEKQGCINVTDHRNVKLGCLHKWTNNEEELSCVCAGDNCNVDISSAASLAFKLFTNFELIALCLLVLFLNSLITLRL